ncbi:MAG: hypothetical protein LBU23_10165 [Planctomycetota bacterium]|jgi:hypothetical protein|nr:hypothetical protein [Planctomycetota bacterium]
MRKSLLLPLALAGLALFPGCGKIAGPRFWWDDQSQARLPDDYQLPADLGAPSEAGAGRSADPSGGDLSEDSLRDFRANLDQAEEKQKSDASLLSF